MTYSAILTPLAIAIEIVIVIMGIYAGYFRKKTFGYLFAFTFMVYAAFDYMGAMGVSADILSVLNIIAILAAFAGMYLVIKEKII